MNVQTRLLDEAIRLLRESQELREPVTPDTVRPCEREAARNRAAVLLARAAAIADGLGLPLPGIDAERAAWAALPALNLNLFDIEPDPQPVEPFTAALRAVLEVPEPEPEPEGLAAFGQ